MVHEDQWATRGAHVCHFTESNNDVKSVVLPFIRQGLLNNEFCLYVTADESPDSWYFELQAYGVDVMAERQSGALKIIDKSEWRRPNRSLRSLAQARKAFRLVPWNEFSGARVIYDAAWALNPELSPDELCHWEATATLLYEGLPVRVICQYDLNRHSHKAIDSALRTHPLVLTGDALVANPHCEAERILEFEPILNYSSADAGEVAKMLSQISPLSRSPGLTKQAFLRGA